MEQRTTTKEWIELFNLGRFDYKDTRTQIKAGWWDWFCRDSSLAGKTKKMGGIIKQIKDGGKINRDATYVWFKNNCPLNGPLYDDFRFANIKDGEVQFTIQIACVWNEKRYAVYGRTPDGVFHNDEPLLATDSRKELIAWLNASW